MSVPILLEQFREYLITELPAVLRKPSVPGVQYPLILDPRDFSPYPGDLVGTSNNDNAMLTAYKFAGQPPGFREEVLLRERVDLWFKTRTAPLAEAIHNKIKPLLVNKYAFPMGSIMVVSCTLIGDLNRIESGSQGYAHMATYYFERESGVVQQ